MNNGHWFDKLNDVWTTFRAGRSGWPDASPAAGLAGGLWSGLTGRQPQIMEVEAEVAAEQRGRLLVVSRQATLGWTLLTCLRQQAPLPTTETVCREGFFTLVTLPTSPSKPDEPLATDRPGELPPDFAYADYQPNWEMGSWGTPHTTSMLWEAATAADLVLYLVQPDSAWQPEDTHWFARLRAMAIPILPVLLSESTATPAAQMPAALIEMIRRATGIRPVALTLLPAPEGSLVNAALLDLLDLLKRILELRPRLALPLAQEAPCYRPYIAQRIIRTGALMAALVGSEPIPLLDVPLQVALQWKVALQLATIYGRPGLDYRSREMLGTVLVNLGVRYAAQEMVKLVPFIGWLLSAALSGVSTWLLGHTLHRYYAQEQGWGWPAPLADRWQRMVAQAQAVQQWTPASMVQVAHRFSSHWRKPHAQPPADHAPTEGTSTGPEDN